MSFGSTTGIIFEPSYSLYTYWDQTIGINKTFSNVSATSGSQARKFRSSRRKLFSVIFVSDVFSENFCN